VTPGARIGAAVRSCRLRRAGEHARRGDVSRVDDPHAHRVERVLGERPVGLAVDARGRVASACGAMVERRAGVGD
jgi:hypothetical protein